MASVLNKQLIIFAWRGERDGFPWIYVYNLTI